MFNFTPIRPSTNWFVKCGNMIIAGCQIHYAIKCKDQPNIIEGKYNDGKKDIPLNNIFICIDE